MLPLEESSVLVAALTLARAVPKTVLSDVAAAIERQPGPISIGARAAVTSGVAQAGNRAAVARFMGDWLEHAPTAPPMGIAWALRAAGQSVAVERSRSSTEIVWTGPNPGFSPLRRTDQALLEVIHAARRTLTVVTFVAYKVPTVAQALVNAARRGVSIRLILESSSASDGKIAYDAVSALGPEVTRMASIYIWPLEQRPLDAAGHHGSLHVKCAVADDRMLLVSSANLTDYALTLNMELGLLIQGGAVPARVSTHLEKLIQQRVLTRITMP